MVEEKEARNIQSGLKMAKDGIAGLANLGKSDDIMSIMGERKSRAMFKGCYLTVSIQCLSNTYELIEYFFQKKHKELVANKIKGTV